MRIFLCSSLDDKNNPLSQRINENIKNTLINRGVCEDDIDEVSSCDDALRLLSTNNSYEAYIITLTNETCFSHGLTHLIGRQKKNKKITFGLVESLAPKHLSNSILDVEERCFRIRKTSLTSNNPKNLERIINAIINRPKIYISYGNDENGVTRKIIKKIDEYMNKVIPYLDIIYDRKKLKIGDSVSTFIKELTDSSRLIIIVNVKYLESEYGMLELMKIFEYYKSNPIIVKKHIFPISYGVKYFQESQLSPVKKYWENKIQETSQEYKKEIQQFQDFIDFIPKIPILLGDLYTSTYDDLEKDNFVLLIWAIYKKSLDDYPRYYDSELDIVKALKVSGMI